MVRLVMLLCCIIGNVTDQSQLGNIFTYELLVYFTKTLGKSSQLPMIYKDTPIQQPLQ